MKKLEVQRDRHFHAYHQLLDAARIALKDAENERPGFYYYQMIAITFSALALESIVNSFGKQFIDRWDDFETANPIAKLRVVCSHLKQAVNFEKEPWATVIWLMQFRNKIAHAKPELIQLNEVMTEKECEQLLYQPPKAKLEKNITLAGAKRAVSAVESIKDILCNKLSAKETRGLLCDSWAGSSSIISD